MELSLTQQFMIILRSLRDDYGIEPVGGTDEMPLFGANVPTGEYKKLIGNRFIRAVCHNGVLCRPLIY